MRDVNDKPYKTLESRAACCVHYAMNGLRSGTAGEACLKGVVYQEVAGKGAGWALRLPCQPAFTAHMRAFRLGADAELGPVGSCASYTPRGIEDVKREDREFELVLRGMASNVSTCCFAPLDESAVLKTGKHKGHGPRRCSECGDVVFMV